MKTDDEIDDMAERAKYRAGWTSDGRRRSIADGDGLGALSSEYDADNEREERAYAQGVEAGLRWVRGQSGAPLPR